MGSVSSIALSGMQAASSWLQVHAHNIANAQTPGYTRRVPTTAEQAGGGVTAGQVLEPGPGTDMTADLTTDTVGLLVQKNAFLANLAVFKTGDQMMGALLNLRA